MGSDKRSVATDALETLGMKIGHQEKRDAIHLAVEPVTAGEELKAGQHIGLRNGKAYLEHNLAQDARCLGIVDPFLTEPLKPGERFWFIVYPRQITSLRHVWSHPAFPMVADLDRHDPVVMSQAKQWVEAYAPTIHEELNYETLMAGARDYLKYGDYLMDGGKYEGCSVNDEFWERFEIIEGPVSNEKKGSFFSCSC